MFINDVRTDFFHFVLRHASTNVVIFCHKDVDSLCAVKILQSLLHNHHISHSIVPVRGRRDLIQSFSAHFNEDVCSGDEGFLETASSGSRVDGIAILLNCGVGIDLVEDLGLQKDGDHEQSSDSTSWSPENVILFVADSYRPLEVTNVYSQSQIRIIAPIEDQTAVPDYDDVFRDSDDEDDADVECGSLDLSLDSEPAFSDSSDAIEKRLENRKRRRKWESRRTEILFEYQKYGYFSTSTAVIMYDLAFRLSRADRTDQLWWAIVGHTSQTATLRVTESTRHHISSADALRGHSSRLANISLNQQASNGGNIAAHNSQQSSGYAVDSLKVDLDRDLSLILYRHWSLIESMYHSIYMASKFKIWCLRGRQKLSEFLADLGLPLSQCKQNFYSMDMSLRSNIVQIVEAKVEKYGLQDLVRPVFVANFGYRHKFCATDFVYLMQAIMNCHSADKCDDFSKSFLLAMDALSLQTNADLLSHGLELARHHIHDLFTQVQNFIDLRSVVAAGPFLYVILPEGAPSAHQFSRCLTSAKWLANHTLRAYCATSASGIRKNHPSARTSATLPLIISIPLNDDEGVCLIVGVPPLAEYSGKNLLGKAFEAALRQSMCRYRLDYFDTSAFQLKSDDRAKFFDALVTVFD